MKRVAQVVGHKKTWLFRSRWIFAIPSSTFAASSAGPNFRHSYRARWLSYIPQSHRRRSAGCNRAVRLFLLLIPVVERTYQEIACTKPIGSDICRGASCRDLLRAVLSPSCSSRQSFKVWHGQTLIRGRCASQVMALEAGKALQSNLAQDIRERGLSFSPE